MSMSEASGNRVNRQLKDRGLSLVSDGDKIRLTPVVTEEPKPKAEPTPPETIAANNTVKEIIKRKIDGTPIEQAQIAKAITGYGRARQHFAGLSPNQRKFLVNRALMETDSEAAKAIGIGFNAVAMWKRKPVFQRAYAALFVDPLDFTEGMLTTLLPKTVEVLESALDN